MRREKGRAIGNGKLCQSANARSSAPCRVVEVQRQTRAVQLEPIGEVGREQGSK